MNQMKNNLTRFNLVPKVIDTPMNFEYEAADNGQVLLADSTLDVISELRYALVKLRSGIQLMVPQPQQDGLVKIINEVLAGNAQPSEPFSCSMSDIDEVVAEFGAPQHVKTEDGEAWYWAFAGRELPMADNLGDLLHTGIQMLKQEKGIHVRTTTRG